MITVLNNQTLFDVALQHCGAMEAAFDIARLNDLSLTDELTAGQTLTVPQPTNKEVVQYYAVNHIAPATQPQRTGRGVGYDRIEVDFKIS